MHAFRHMPWDAKTTFLTICRIGSDGFESMKEAFLYNCFRKCGEAKASRFYVLCSRFNHSCLPNCTSPAGQGKFETFARRDIEAGEELVFSYGAHFMNKTSSERGRDMEAMGFACDCRACVPGTELQLLSDMRRRLARGLGFFIWGKDGFSTGDPHSTSRPVIPDPQRRWAAEHHAMPTTSRMVFALLFLVLTEKEGTLSPHYVEEHGRAIRTFMQWFKTESNIRISRLAMRQSTWLGRLRVACEMYVRPDAADPKIARRFCVRAGPV